MIDSIVASLFGVDFNEVAMDIPVLITPGTSPTAIVSESYKWVLDFMFRLRALNTSTYVGIGTQTSQNWRMTIVGETFGWSANPKEVFDLSKLYIMCDGGDAVVELMVLYYPIPMLGNVELAQQRSIGK